MRFIQKQFQELSIDSVQLDLAGPEAAAVMAENFFKSNNEAVMYEFIRFGNGSVHVHVRSKKKTLYSIQSV
jgi:hypothetical protein